jgi:hypothetical protein
MFSQVKGQRLQTQESLQISFAISLNNELQTLFGCN